MRSIAFTILLTGTLTGLAARQGVDDPAVRAAVERFFAVQEAEDVAGYLALWSSTVPQLRMQQLPSQLKFIFESGDDKFSGITITRVVPNGDELRVRVNAVRDRTSIRRQPDGTPIVSHSTLQTSLTFVREGGELKLLREGSAADDLAAAFLAAATAGDRDALLAAEPELVNEYFVTAVSRQAELRRPVESSGRALQIYERALEIARRVSSRRMEETSSRTLRTPVSSSVTIPARSRPTKIVWRSFASSRTTKGLPAPSSASEPSSN